MRIAILMSTYNGATYLRQQLDSLVDQTLKEYIYIYIRDDSSSDDTVHILEEYRALLKIKIFKGKNVGPANSFWELFCDEAIHADYYAFCDQDDIWDNDKIEKGVAAIGASKQPTLWCSNCRLIDSSNEIVQERMNVENPNYCISSQLVSGTTQGCAMLFNNELRKIILNKQVTQLPMHDFVVVIYASIYGVIIYDETPSFSYRVHSNNVIANNQKSVYRKLNSTIKRWFSKKHRGEVSAFARDVLIKNSSYLDDETKQYIAELTKCRVNILSRIRIIKSPLTKTNDSRALRSFRIRTLLGII